MTDILTRLRTLDAGRVHYRLLVLAGIGWMFDAMDTGMVSFVLPVLAQDWNLPPAQLGYIVSIAFAGMAAGAAAGGWLADRFGRKTVFAAAMLVYGTATGLCALAHNMETLLFYRFWVGVGLGAQLPAAVALVGEYAPPKVRGRFIVLLESFWGLGWLAAALAAYFLIPKLGWQAAFAVGALPVLYVPLVWKYIPESVPYLVSRGKIEEAHRLVCRLEREAGREPAAAAEAAPAPVPERPRFGMLWQPPFARRTLMLWAVWFGIMFSYYGIFTWLPKLLVAQGHTVVKTFEYVLWMIVAQLPGYLAAAALVEKIGRKATLAGFLAACAVCAWLFGRSVSPAELVVWGGLMSFFNLGAWGVLYTYTPELYPLRFRAFASGWAGSAGRIGGIAAPAVVASLMDAGGGFGLIFFMFAAVMMSAAALIAWLGEETKGRDLEEISS